VGALSYQVGLGNLLDVLLVLAVLCVPTMGTGVVASAMRSLSCVKMPVLHDTLEPATLVG
jgi:hypothetical protein